MNSQEVTVRSKPRKGSRTAWAAAAGAALVVGGVMGAAPRAGAVVLNPGDVVVVDPVPANGDDGALIRVRPGTSVQTVISSNGLFSLPVAVAVEPGGTLLVADQGPAPGGVAAGLGTLIRVDPATGAQTALVAPGQLAAPAGLFVDPQGGIFVTDDAAGDQTEARVFQVNPATGALTPVTAGNLLLAPGGVVPVPGDALLVADPGFEGPDGAIIRVDRATGEQSLLSFDPRLIDPYGLALEPAGTVLIADPGSADPDSPDALGSIFRLDPATGDLSVLSSGNLLVDPYGVTVAPDGSIFVADGGDPARVLQIDPVTGAQSVVATGNLLQLPFGAAVVAPEPAGAGLLLVGAMAALARRRRRARQPAGA